MWGPSPIVYFGGSSYFVTFIDDYSRKVWVYMLERKVEEFNILNNIELWLKRALTYQSNV